MLSNLVSSVVVKEAVVFCKTDEYACTDTPIAEDCRAVSARSSEAFTLASNLDSSIEEARIVAVKSLAVIARSISEVSETVSIVFTSAPVSIPASFVFSVAEYCL